MKLVLLGAPGAGKGTQAALIAEHFQIPHISTGDIFRENIKNETELGLKAKHYIEEGLLVPDELTTDLVVHRVQEEDCENGYILDGFPRTIPQAECFDAVLEELGMHLDVALDVDVKDEVLIRRISGRRVCSVCGETFHVESLPPKTEGICDVCHGPLIRRKDDDPETVLHRLQVYREKTEPLIAYYKERGILVSVDGDRPVETVFEDIIKILEAFS